jgi:hypothetical protein
MSCKLQLNQSVITVGGARTRSLSQARSTRRGPRRGDSGPINSMLLPLNCWRQEIVDIGDDDSTLTPVPHVHRVGDACCNGNYKSVIRPRTPLKPKNKTGPLLLMLCEFICLILKYISPTDPVNLGAAYRSQWSSVRAPGERSHAQLRHATHNMIRRQVRTCLCNLSRNNFPICSCGDWQEEVLVRPQRPITVNTYVAPTDKKRLALRWNVRSHLAHAS